MTGYWKAHYVPHRKAQAYKPDLTLGGRQYVLIEYRWYVTQTAKWSSILQDPEKFREAHP